MGRRERKIERRRKRNSLIVGLLLIFLMVFAVVGFAIQGPIGGGLGSGFEYNGFEFEFAVRQGVQLLITEVDGQEIGFYTEPDTATNLHVDEGMNEVLRNANTVYVTRSLTSTSEDVSIYEILLRDYRNFASVNVEGAYLERDPLDPSPVITCDDATETNPVIKINYETNRTSPGFYEISDFCYETSGIGFDIIQMRDYLIYNDRGIIW